MHQELLEASWQHVLGLFVATITDVGHQHLTLEPPADPVVNTSGLTPVFLLGDTEKMFHSFIMCSSLSYKVEVIRSDCIHTDSYRNLDISVRLVANELLGSLFDNLGLCEGPEGCHGD